MYGVLWLSCGDMACSRYQAVGNGHRVVLSRGVQQNATMAHREKWHLGRTGCKVLSGFGQYCNALPQYRMLVPLAQSLPGLASGVRGWARLVA